ncbi:MAG: hypothetical protein AAGC88_08225 [Bacteroidota bacterium]
MKYTFLAIVVSILAGCSPSKPTTDELSTEGETPIAKNNVMVMGMIHGGHLTSTTYGNEGVGKIIKTIAPDVIITEIPPDRFDTAMTQFEETDSISEPRVRRFPEYVDVIFPLTKTMDFGIVPSAGWTKPMSDARAQRMKEISEDPAWAERWQLYKEAIAKSDSAVDAVNGAEDPYFINSDAYDEAAEIYLSVYNELLNDELGHGGWDNINESHYSYIEQALDSLSGQDITILITYGAGHKGWFMRELRKRTDIELLNMHPFIVEALK